MLGGTGARSGPRPGLGAAAAVGSPVHTRRGGPEALPCVPLAALLAVQLLHFMHVSGLPLMSASGQRLPCTLTPRQPEEVHMVASGALRLPGVSHY